MNSYYETKSSNAMSEESSFFVDPSGRTTLGSGSNSSISIYAYLFSLSNSNTNRRPSISSFVVKGDHSHTSDTSRSNVYIAGSPTASSKKFHEVEKALLNTSATFSRAFEFS